MTTVVGLIALYLVPTAIAGGRQHRNVASIAVLNILLGWTVLGWIGALVWAFTNQAPVKQG